MLAKIAEMPESDRVMAERLHAVITASAGPLAEALVRDARLTAFALKELTRRRGKDRRTLVKSAVS